MYQVFLGFIVRFEIGELSKYYFIDPEWLNKVFSSLVSRDNIADCGAPGHGKYSYIETPLAQYMH